jgi:hypothetical protein
LTRLSLRPLVLADLALGVVLFILAWVFSEADEGAGELVGAIGWFGFWACVLAMLALGIVAAVRRFRRPATA